MKNIKHFILVVLFLIVNFCFSLIFAACDISEFISESFSDKENEINTDTETETETIDNTNDKNPDYENNEDVIGDTEDESVHIHSFGEWVIFVDPTCTQEGSKKCFCSCGEMKTEIITPLGHDFIEHAELLPTCTQPGWSMYNECVRCGYSDKEELSPLGHNFGEWKIIENPTCTKEGTKIRICSHDEVHYESVTIPKSNHTPSEWVTAIEPSCCSEGNKLQKCSVCALLLQTEQLPELGHDFGEWDLIKLPDCITEGKEERVCSRDKSHVEVRSVDKLSHMESDWLVQSSPTCLTDGKELKKCLVCFTVLDEAVIPHLGHDFGDWIVETSASCLTAGEEVRICSHDNNHIESRIIDAKGHTVERIDVILPACGQQGLGNVKCVKCSEILEEYILPALEHDYGDWIIYEEATCLTDGTERRYCSYDETHYEERNIGKTEHTAGEWTVSIEPTCVSDGKIVKVCEVCGEELQSEILSAHGHTYDDNICLNCDTDFGGTKCMDWALSEDGESYVLCGIGEAVASDIIIPSVYNGKPVTEISDNAFCECEIINSVFIPESVVKIGSYAFYNSSLSNIKFEKVDGWTMNDGNGGSIAITEDYFNYGEVLYFIAKDSFYCKYFWLRA